LTVVSRENGSDNDSVRGQIAIEVRLERGRKREREKGGDCLKREREKERE
jgi:hypothetical protein